MQAAQGVQTALTSLETAASTAEHLYPASVAMLTAMVNEELSLQSSTGIHIRQPQGGTQRALVAAKLATASAVLSRREEWSAPIIQQISADDAAILLRPLHTLDPPEPSTHHPVCWHPSDASWGHAATSKGLCVSVELERFCTVDC